MDSTALSLPENQKPIFLTDYRCFGLSSDRNSKGNCCPQDFRPGDRPKDQVIFLTDYVILKSQCPLWEERTDNVRDIYKLQHDLMKSGLSPRGYTSFIKRLKDGPLATAWKLLRQRKAYDLVITGDTNVGLYYAVFRNLLDRGGPPPQLFIDFMLDRPQANAFWRFKKRLQGYIMSGIECTIVFSTGEISAYSQILHLKPSKFYYLPYHTNILKPEFVASHQGYIFSAGRSGRDYKTLLEAVKGLDIPVIIISDQRSLEGLTIPPNVKVHYDVSYDNYLQILRNAHLIVVPLQPDIRSLGMVVMLEGMALGKPVITTKGASNVEYIRDGENGLFVNSGDWQELKTKIQYLIDRPDECLRLGQNALTDVNKYWTFDVYVKSVLDVGYKMVKGEG